MVRFILSLPPLTFSGSYCTSAAVCVVLLKSSSVPEPKEEPMQANLLESVPPDQFGIVESNIYRGRTFDVASFSFVGQLRLKSLIYLSPELSRLRPFLDSHPQIKFVSCLRMLNVINRMRL